MPMFDDPNRELQWLEEALLAEEYEAFYEEEDVFGEDPEEYDEDAALLEEAKELIGDKPRKKVRRRNPAMEFSRTAYADEAFDEKAAVAPLKRKKKGIGGLTFLALLEIAGILAIAWWWIQWLY